MSQIPGATAFTARVPFAVNGPRRRVYAAKKPVSSRAGE